jgi:hypothetical protein
MEGNEMAHQQKQSYCYRCQQVSLHTRDTYEVPHVLHLGLALLMCGLWLPFWILHAALNAYSTMPYRCSVCGQIAGERIDSPWARAIGRSVRKSLKPGVSDSTEQATR